MPERAKVFVSCGQKEGSHERAIASRIADALTELGFSPYIAFTEQTLSGLKENIFVHLESSEYFLFIDFKRDRLDGCDVVHRGSLFSNQELAIASFLHLPAIVLQESGVKVRDGMMGAFQANALIFQDSEELPSLVREIVGQKIANGEWSPGWKNGLALELPSNHMTVAQSMDHSGNHVVHAFYHIEVRNLHRRKTALNCCVFLEKAAQVGKDAPLPIRPIEFKWAGSPLPNVLIGPQASRKFDAFKKPCMARIGQIVLSNPLLEDDPVLVGLEFNAFCDSTEFLPRIYERGTFDLTYSVYSSNFPLSSATFRIENGSQPTKVSVQKIA
jgi:hypothetical protein